VNENTVFNQVYRAYKYSAHQIHRILQSISLRFLSKNEALCLDAHLEGLINR